MNKIYLQAPEEDYLPSLQDIIRLFFPDKCICTNFSEPPAEEDIIIRAVINLTGVITANIYIYQDKREYTHRENALENTGDKKNEAKRLVRLALFRLLTQLTGAVPSPWGILTGIRPTKVIHRLFDLGYGSPEIINKLITDYSLSKDKAKLVTETAKRQRKFLLNKTEASKLVSIYIGIPFCPTRCLYCSFPAYPIKKFKSWVEPFLKALMQEIIEIGTAIRECGLQVQTIYFGGGTPTSISVEQLEALLNSVNKYLRFSQTLEITIEGGRPDTLSPEILAVCAEAGVNRLSINPQTMQEKTLNTIGREHTVNDIYQAMEAARKIGFPVINMDLIVGLPGETGADVTKTMSLIKSLSPENLTVHALAVKKASLLKQELHLHKLPGESEAVKMWEITRQGALNMGLIPYYLYRQKRIIGNLENIGYALPGKECIYNIHMIEEKQTIIGLGAGAGSKWLRPDDWLLTNRYNPKDPLMYTERIEELIKWKKQEISNLTRLEKSVPL
ncbi:coproporphyrinogen dehydrogenase HemZ [Desulfolucanica intricata]|uniref:coproporphyrinogen dehydrogenase HemZ n=1 Tax=Desulfolucanica intricata TaxID=1285191 RepID=UPI00082E3C5D|nr:coproporphyrinogen dehydrogenase HemZ [Desulfolucanica intricata]